MRPIRPPSRRARCLAVTGTASAVLLALAPTLPSFAQEPAPRGAGVDIQGERRGHADADRRGRAATTDGQRAAGRGRARFGALGTPAVVADAGRPLATGLPADPEAAARAYLTRERALFGLSQEQVDSLEVVTVNPLGKGAAVLLRQVFGELRTAHDGLVSVGVVDGSVVSATSSLTRGTAQPQPARLTEAQAVEVALGDAGLDDAETTAELVALPVPEGARSAWQIVTAPSSEGEVEGYATYVDAVTGEVLLREDLVDHASDDPTWKVFTSNPPADYSSTDTRATWSLTGAGGTEAVRDPATGEAWDVLAGSPTLTTNGGSARAGETRNDLTGRAIPVRTARASATRTYEPAWTNAWYTAKCDPAVLTQKPVEADLEAAMVNLFAAHNRMHDWSYGLGFTETAWNLQYDNGNRGEDGEDSEQGNAQAGAFSPTIRDNANQFTPPDGQRPISNMYLWQPIAGAFYAPCVDGDYDMSVIGHEYGHAISNRMVAGPDAGLSGPQAGAMGESWSDLLATEYAREFGYRNAGVTPYVVGAYVTGDPVAGIRNYDMSRSPLNYSDVGYDLTGPQVHSDGEIWSATNHALREAMNARHGAGTPALQRACAVGQTPYEQCPGNRRWMQLVFDSYLLMAQGSVSMVDARDALLAAERIRTGGADQDLLKAVFASRGLGVGASSTTNADADPVPSFATGTASDASVTFVGAGLAGTTPLRIYVGDHEARAVPVADTDPSTPLGSAVMMTPGTYTGLAVGQGVGHTRFTFEVRARRARAVSVPVTPNLASAAAGATATGDGVNQDKLIDETEGTNWASVNAGPVAGKGVTVDLAGDLPARISRVQVSAALRPTIATDVDGAGQNRYTALRSFRVLACDATRADCGDAASFRPVFTSPADAFPSTRPRPRVTDLTLRSFAIPATRATHVRLEAVTSQCTGGPAYQGEQDADPRSATDCDTATTSGDDVRAAELQVFAR